MSAREHACLLLEMACRDLKALGGMLDADPRRVPPARLETILRHRFAGYPDVDGDRDGG
jgi:hypothetical protein